MKNLRSLSVSVAVLILILGVLLPIFATVQEERVYLAYTELMESDILDDKMPRIVLNDNSEQFVYLMKHPKETLKNCLKYELENPEGAKLLLNTTLGIMAFQKITDEKSMYDALSLNATVQKQDPKLYEELVAE